MIRPEKEIRAKIEDSIKALEDFMKRTDVGPEEFFVVARQATFLTALYWVLNEDVPQTVTKLAVPVLKKMSEMQSKEAEEKAKESK